MRKKNNTKKQLFSKTEFLFHGTATIEIKLKQFEVEKKTKKKKGKRKHISNSIFLIIFKKKNIQ